MLQKELIKRLKGEYETKMDDKGWLNVSSDGIPLCRVKYNSNCIINDDENLSDEYREKIADIQDEVLTVREYIWTRKTHGNIMSAVTPDSSTCLLPMQGGCGINSDCLTTATVKAAVRSITPTG